jgi:hypothetical protein
MQNNNPNNDLGFSAHDALVVARDVWRRLPGTGAVFFQGYEQKWHDEFANYSFVDLLNGIGLIADDVAYRKDGDKIGIGIFYKYVQDAQELRKRYEYGVSKYCQERTHTGKYFGVWHFAHVMAKNEGTCWLSEHVTAAHCGLSHDTARRAIEWLVERGWLEVVIEPQPGKRGSYRPIEHNQWTDRHGYGDCLLNYKKRTAE